MFIVFSLIFDYVIKKKNVVYLVIIKEKFLDGLV